MRIYTADNLINFRDLGGYKCKSGFTRDGIAFRCGIPRDPTEKDLKLLRELGIKTVIDLRGIEEAKDRPSNFADDPDFDFYHISLLEANPALSKSKIPLCDMYAMSMKDYSVGYRDLFRLIGQLDGPFMFHCFLGKDRTGILAALLLSEAGVSREDIIENYVISYDLFIGYIENEIRNNTGLIWEQDLSRFKSERKTIECILDYIDNEFGSTRNFLKYTGLTDEEIDKAVSKITDLPQG